MVYVGFGHHKNFSYITVMDEKEQIVKQQKIANDKSAHTQFMDQLKDEKVFFGGVDPISRTVFTLFKIPFILLLSLSKSIVTGFPLPFLKPCCSDHHLWLQQQQHFPQPLPLSPLHLYV